MWLATHTDRDLVTTCQLREALCDLVPTVYLSVHLSAVYLFTRLHSPGFSQHDYLTVSGALILVPGDISGRDEDMQGDLTDFREYSLQQLAIRLSLRHQHQHVLVLYHL